MSSLSNKRKATIIPVLRYRNAPAAIEWLCQTFGFEKHLVVPNGDGTIAHAQLSGGRDFSCYDPEGHLWSFGTYDP
jgi:uncharacterized glyoxalase superfamily protein PhnB